MNNIHETAIIGIGYWGSIIFNSLSKITKKKIYIFDINKKNSLLLKKRFNNRIIIAKNLDEILEIREISNFILATHQSINFN